MKDKSPYKSETEYSKKTYDIGDYYENGDVKGIVYKIYNKGYQGMIFSLDSIQSVWGDIVFLEQDIVLPSYDGMINLELIKQTSDWENTFPAFEWCVYNGDGWYLPSIYELKELYMICKIFKSKIESILIEKGGVSIFEEHNFAEYWSSSPKYIHDFNGWSYISGINFSDGEEFEERQDYPKLIRAVRHFNTIEPSSLKKDPTHEKICKKKDNCYSFGDLYDVGGIKGIVYKVSEDGQHGMILSLDEFKSKWAVPDIIIFGISKDNGEVNTKNSKRIDNWEKLLPGFKWCSDLGDGWYIPSIDELEEMYNCIGIPFKGTVFRRKFHRILSEHGGKSIYKSCWSSSQYNSGRVYAFHMESGIGASYMLNGWSFRAVHKF